MTVYIDNQCSLDIYIAIRYFLPDKRYKNLGWIKINSYKCITQYFCNEVRSSELDIDVYVCTFPLGMYKFTFKNIYLKKTKPNKIFFKKEHIMDRGYAMLNEYHPSFYKFVVCKEFGRVNVYQYLKKAEKEVNNPSRSDGDLCVCVIL